MNITKSQSLQNSASTTAYKTSFSDEPTLSLPQKITHLFKNFLNRWVKKEVFPQESSSSFQVQEELYGSGRAGALFFYNDGTNIEILLGEEGGKHPTFGDFGGKGEKGESRCETAIREAVEETCCLGWISEANLRARIQDKQRSFSTRGAYNYVQYSIAVSKEEKAQMTNEKFIQGKKGLIQKLEEQRENLKKLGEGLKNAPNIKLKLPETCCYQEKKSVQWVRITPEIKEAVKKAAEEVHKAEREALEKTRNETDLRTKGEAIKKACYNALSSIASPTIPRSNIKNEIELGSGFFKTVFKTLLWACMRVAAAVNRGFKAALNCVFPSTTKEVEIELRGAFFKTLVWAHLRGNDIFEQMSTHSLDPAQKQIGKLQLQEEQTQNVKNEINKILSDYALLQRQSKNQARGAQFLSSVRQMLGSLFQFVSAPFQSNA